MREASEDVCEEAEVVHSVRIVVLWAMQELKSMPVSQKAQQACSFDAG